MIAITGKVIRGQKYGRVLGFPTANLDRREFVRKKMKVKLGVWAGRATIVSSSKYQVVREYKAAIVIGPIDKYHLPKIEAHLLNFKGSLYGKKINIYLNKYLRPFKKYKTIELLKKQIAGDVKRIKKLKY